MSYILDALRRADAERARGAVPGLHDQVAPRDDGSAARRPALLLRAAGLAGVAAVAIVLLLWAPWRGDDRAAQATPARSLPPAPLERDRTGPPAVAPAALPSGLPQERVAGPAGGPPAAPPAMPYPPPPGAAATVVERMPAASGAATPASAPAATVEHYGPPLAAPAPPAASAVPNINELAPGVRAQLPHLVVGGAIYSESRADRMVILNGQVWHEGEKPAADTVLEQIRLKSAVLNFRGQRYEITY